MNRLLAVLGAVLIACAGVGAGAAPVSATNPARQVKPPASREEAHQLLRRGWELRGQGRLEEAIAALEMAYKWDPHLTLEWWEGRENRDGPWRQYFLAVDADLAIAYLRLGRARSDAALLERSENLFQVALERNPEGDALAADLRTCRTLLTAVRAKTKLPPPQPLVLISGRPVKWATAPALRNDVILVAAEELSRALGLEYSPGATVREASIRSPRVTISLSAESRSARVGDEERVLDTAPTMQGSLLLVPLRFVTEASGGLVRWDPVARIAHVALPEERLIPK